MTTMDDYIYDERLSQPFLLSLLFVSIRVNVELINKIQFLDILYICIVNIIIYKDKKRMEKSVHHVVVKIL